MHFKANLQDLKLIWVILLLIPVGMGTYVGRPLVNHGEMPADSAHKIVIDVYQNLGGGQLIGFTFLTVENVPPGIIIYPAVRMQIWEMLDSFLPAFKLVLEKRVEMTKESLNRNITVPLAESERINLTSSHRLGLTNEGQYCLVDFDKTVDVIQKDIKSDPGIFHYPTVGETVKDLPFPLPLGYSMGIHSIQGEDNYLEAEAITSTLKPFTSSDSQEQSSEYDPDVGSVFDNEYENLATYVFPSKTLLMTLMLFTLFIFR